MIISNTHRSHPESPFKRCVHSRRSATDCSHRVPSGTVVVFCFSVNSHDTYTFQVTLRFTAILLTNTIANAWIVIPTCLFMATILILKLYYMKTSREIKRLEAIGRFVQHNCLLRPVLVLKSLFTFLLSSYIVPCL